MGSILRRAFRTIDDEDVDVTSRRFEIAPRSTGLADQQMDRENKESHGGRRSSAADLK
jgi:hypothetical protein